MIWNIKMKPRIKYDSKVNILRINFANKKTVDSEAVGNVVIDYDQKGNIVNLEIMDIDLGEFLKIESSQKLIPNLPAQ